MNQRICILITLLLALTSTPSLLSTEKKSSCSILNAHQKELANLLHKYPLLPLENFNKKPFHTACTYQAHDIIKFFIQHNVNINEKIYLEHHGYTALDIACIYGHASVVKTLLENDAIISIHSSDGKTPLHHAAYFEHTNVLQLLLMHDIEKIIINIDDYQGKTALDYAFFKKNQTSIDLLIYHGASFHFQSQALNISPFALCMKFIATYPNCIHKERLAEFTQILEQQKLTQTYTNNLLLHTIVHNQKTLDYPHTFITTYFLKYKHAKNSDSIKFLSQYLPQRLVTKIMSKSPYFTLKNHTTKADCTLITSV